MVSIASLKGLRKFSTSNPTLTANESATDSRFELPALCQIVSCTRLILVIAKRALYRGKMPLSISNIQSHAEVPEESLGECLPDLVLSHVASVSFLRSCANKFWIDAAIGKDGEVWPTGLVFFDVSGNTTLG